MNQYNNCRPQFKSCFRCEILPSEGVVLLSEKNSFFFPPSFIELAQLLNGQHTIDEIINLLHKKLSPWEVLSLLDKIRDYVVDTPPPIPLEQAAFWETLKITPQLVHKRLQATSVNIIALGNINPTSLQTLLASLGIQLSDQGERWVVLTDDYLQEGLDDLNKKALAEKRSWILIKPVGTEPWIGPLLIPNETGCWECLRHRLESRRPIEAYLQQKKKATDLCLKPLTTLPSTEQMAFSLAATEIVKWIVFDRNKTLEGKIVTINTLTLDKRDHSLINRPQCPACGRPNLVSQRQSLPPMLGSCQKNFTADGGHRHSLPQETVQRLEQQISPITGIISRLERTNYEEKDLSLTPVYLSKGIFGEFHDDLNSIYKSLNHYSGGKGKTDIQAKVSAIGEAIER